MTIPSALTRSFILSKKVKEQTDEITASLINQINNDAPELFYKLTKSISEHNNTLAMFSIIIDKFEEQEYTVALWWQCSQKCGNSSKYVEEELDDDDDDEDATTLNCFDEKHQIHYKLTLNVNINVDDDYDKKENDQCPICLEDVYKKLQSTLSCDTCNKHTHLKCINKMPFPMCPLCRGINLQ